MKYLLMIFSVLLSGCFSDEGCDPNKYVCQKKTVEHHVSDFRTVCIDHVLYFNDAKTMTLNPVSPVFDAVTKNVVVCE